jgi:hypothetical protein
MWRLIASDVTRPEAGELGGVLIGSVTQRGAHANRARAMGVKLFGLLGEHREAQRSLTRADSLWERRNPENDLSWLYWTYLPSLTPEVPRNIIPGNPRRAEAMFMDGLDAHSDKYPRDHTLFCLGLAETRLSLATADSTRPSRPHGPRSTWSRYPKPPRPRTSQTPHPPPPEASRHCGSVDLSGGFPGRGSRPASDDGV